MLSQNGKVTNIFKQCTRCIKVHTKKHTRLWYSGWCAAVRYMGRKPWICAQDYRPVSLTPHHTTAALLKSAVFFCDKKNKFSYFKSVFPSNSKVYFSGIVTCISLTPSQTATAATVNPPNVIVRTTDCRLGWGRRNGTGGSWLIK